MKCTPDVLKKATTIINERSNGSEFLLLVHDGIVFYLDICDIHDDVVIDCGEAL